MNRAAANILIIMLYLSGVGSFAQVNADLQRKLAEAERRIVRIAPSAFPGLPRNLSGELERRGCTIPQGVRTGRDNVARGEFQRAGQTDWAVLCSIKGVSTILVFWNGSEKGPAELFPREDRDFLQSAGGDDIVFSREISAVGKDFIERHYEAYGGQEPPPIDHQGIDDAFLGKASVTYYFYNRKWVKLTGAD
jgi:hypothetical protein